MFGNNEDVALIRKNRPAWQKGKLNGIGGHIEQTDKTPYDAMVREFEEETGFSEYTCFWYEFASLEGESYKVYFFYTTRWHNIESSWQPSLEDAEKQIENHKDNRRV